MTLSELEARRDLLSGSRLRCRKLIAAQDPAHHAGRLLVEHAQTTRELRKVERALLEYHQLHTAADPDSVAARVEHPATEDSHSEAGATGEAGPYDAHRCGSATSSKALA